MFFIALIAVVTVAFLVYKRLGRNLPPGPPNLPVLGSLPFIETKNIFNAASKLSKQYKSDVISMGLGPKLVVFLQTYDVIKEWFSNDDFIERPGVYFMEYVYKHSALISSCGEGWKERRQFITPVLSGKPKKAQESQNREEILHLISEITKRGSNCSNLMSLFAIASTRSTCHAFFDRRFAHDDGMFFKLVYSIVGLLHIVPDGGILDMMPCLRHLPKSWFGLTPAMEAYDVLFWFSRENLEQEIERFSAGERGSCVVAGFLEKRAQLDKKNVIHCFTDDILEKVIADLIVAGVVTTFATNLWGILSMVTHPDVQRRVQQELDDVIGQDRLPDIDDRQKLPYTQAVIHEIYRFGSVGAIGLPRSNKRELNLNGYTIPKGTMVFANIHAVHRDPRFWKFPDRFDPGNFLDENGNFVPSKYLIPFSLGRRQCPGENIAKVEVFLTLTSLLHKFVFSLPEGVPRPGLEGELKFIYLPPEFEVHATPRF